MIDMNFILHEILWHEISSRFFFLFITFCCREFDIMKKGIPHCKGNAKQILQISRKRLVKVSSNISLNDAGNLKK